MTETTASGAAQDSTGARKGLTIRRINTREGVHPYDEVTWERRDGRTCFRIEFPAEGGA